MRLGLTAEAAHFSVRYDGPAVSERHTIDAAALGSSLMALADLIDETQKILDPDARPYRVEVRSTGAGSFEVFMELAESWDNVKHLFTSEDA